VLESSLPNSRSAFGQPYICLADDFSQLTFPCFFIVGEAGRNVAVRLNENFSKALPKSRVSSATRMLVCCAAQHEGRVQTDRELIVVIREKGVRTRIG
jgi:hypothetical protein